jgi:hypothetical protein
MSLSLFRKVLYILHQSEKVLLNRELIGNRVQITDCRATVSNTQKFSSLYPLRKREGDENRYKSGDLPVPTRRHAELTMLPRYEALSQIDVFYNQVWL